MARGGRRRNGFVLEWKEEHMASRNQTTCMQIRRLGIDFFPPSWKFVSLIGVEIGYFLYFVSYQNHLLLPAPTAARRTHPKSRVPLPQQDSHGSEEVEAAEQGAAEATSAGAREGRGTGPVEAADAGSRGGHRR